MLRMKYEVYDLMEYKSEEGMTVKTFIEDNYGIEHDFSGVVAIVVASIAVLFAFIFVVAIKTFNFRKR